MLCGIEYLTVSEIPKAAECVIEDCNCFYREFPTPPVGRPGFRVFVIADTAYPLKCWKFK